MDGSNSELRERKQSHESATSESGSKASSEPPPSKDKVPRPAKKKSQRSTSSGSERGSSESSAAFRSESSKCETQTKPRTTATSSRSSQNVAWSSSAILIAVLIVLFLMRMRYSGLHQPFIPDTVTFNITTDPSELQGLELQSFQKILNKSIDDTNEEIRKISKGLFFPKEKDQRGHAVFGFHDFFLVGVDRVEGSDNWTLHEDAEPPHAATYLKLSGIEFRGIAKWSWAFQEEVFNCTSSGYSWILKVTAPEKETGRIEWMELQFPELKKFMCNKFYRYPKHSRREAKKHIKYSFRYAIQEFVVRSFKTIWDELKKRKAM